MVKCCKCNALGSCLGCACVKRNTPCTKCAPGAKRCQNRGIRAQWTSRPRKRRPPALSIGKAPCSSVSVEKGYNNLAIIWKFKMTVYLLNCWRVNLIRPTLVMLALHQRMSGQIQARISNLMIRIAVATDFLTWIGGRGRLADHRINSLQRYYGNSIKNHAGNLSEMKRSIWASFPNTVSTNDRTHHEYFLLDWIPGVVGGNKKLVGPNTPITMYTLEPWWMKWNQYRRVAETSLLDRCARSATQNAHESLNGLIWSMGPKESFCSRNTVETTVHLAVVTFNEGFEKVSAVLASSSCTVSLACIRFVKTFDANKAYHKRFKSSKEEKSSRKRRRALALESCNNIPTIKNSQCYRFLLNFTNFERRMIHLVTPLPSIVHMLQVLKIWRRYDEG